MKPIPCIFQPDLDFSEFNPSKSKSIKISVFNITNKDVWLEMGTVIGSLEIVSTDVTTEIQNMQVDAETFAEYQEGNSHIPNCNNENKFLPRVDLSHLPNDQRIKIEKPLVEECEVFSKNENGIGRIESLKLKLKVHKCRFENLTICLCSYKNNTLKIVHS